VRQIVEQHGGTIDVESTVDQGTAFTIWLPRQSAPDAAEAPTGQAQVA
jgi:signal transduction histidine kinase